MSEEPFTLDDIFGARADRPDHPDFWLLSEIILQLRASMQDHFDDPKIQYDTWRSAYDSIGDFNSIAYHAIQCGLQTGGYPENITGAQLAEIMSDPREKQAYIRAVQCYFDGFKMGAEFMRRKHE